MKGIVKPTLLLDRDKCLRNIAKMAAKARQHDLVLRPHFKTHQSHGVGNWFREAGTTAITVSSVDMAHYFADDGWEDITIAFPFNRLEMDAINQLVGPVSLNLLLLQAESVPFLEKHLHGRVGVFVKIDVGYHRTGIAANDAATLDALMQALEGASRLTFKGFLTHAGHTYHARSRDEIRRIHGDAKDQLLGLKERYQGRFPHLVLSIGDTPACSVAEDFAGIDEIRPGNFVFYDVTQWQLGACRAEEIAVALACPIVAKHPARHEVVVYGGGVHLSKEHGRDRAGRKIYGRVADLGPTGWKAPHKESFVIGLSQEHGVVSMAPQDFERCQVGGLIAILPIHACLTANLMGAYKTLDGKVISHRNHKG